MIDKDDETGAPGSGRQVNAYDDPTVNVRASAVRTETEDQVLNAACAWFDACEADGNLEFSSALLARAVSIMRIRRMK